MCEKECEDSRQLKTKTVFAGSSRVGFPRSETCAQHITGMRRVNFRMETAGFRECLAGKAFLWDTRKTFYFSELSCLIHTFFTHTIYTPINHICWGVLLRENPSHNPWELEIVTPTFLYTIHCGFSSTLTSPFSYPWEVDRLNTFHTLSECQVRFWCYWKALEEAKLWRMQSGILQDLES